MQAIRFRTIIVAASVVGLGALSACNSGTGSSGNAADAMIATGNAGSMADGAAMMSGNGMAADGDAMTAGNGMGDAMQSSDSMQKNSR